jgi:hypothetical protein
LAPRSEQAQLVNTWPLLFHLDDPESANARLEPTEREAWHYDFVIPGAITVVGIHTYIDNPAEAFGWRTTTLYELSGTTGGGREAKCLLESRNSVKDPQSGSLSGTVPRAGTRS